MVFEKPCSTEHYDKSLVSLNFPIPAGLGDQKIVKTSGRISAQRQETHRDLGVPPPEVVWPHPTLSWWFWYKEPRVMPWSAIANILFSRCLGGRRTHYGQIESYCGLPPNGMYTRCFFSLPEDIVGSLGGTACCLQVYTSERFRGRAASPLARPVPTWRQIYWNDWPGVWIPIQGLKKESQGHQLRN